MNLSKCLIKRSHKGTAGYFLPVRCIQQTLALRCEHEKKERYGQQLGGFEYKPETFGTTNKWRRSFEERGFWQSNIALFASKKFKGDKFQSLNPDNFKYMRSPKMWWKYHTKQMILEDQKYSEERVTILGPDLGAAHFTVFRGGAVKFYNQDEWIRDDTKLKEEYDDDLPNTFDANYVVEGLDLSRMAILYEGLINIERLRKLKWLSVSGCGQFDNWCMDKISTEYGDTLEYLDISHTSVSYFGLNALYRCRKLKTLVLDDNSDDVEFYQMCSELKKCMPDLSIEGVSQEFLNYNKDDDKLMQSA